MANKKIGAILLHNDKHFEDLFKEAEKDGCERGLVLRTPTNITEQLITMFDKCAKQGYFVTGFILEGHNIEVIFQRHPQQKKENRMAELKPCESDKYKL